jgi:hypothetical protein
MVASSPDYQSREILLQLAAVMFKSSARTLNPAFVTRAEAAFIAGFLAGQSYANIHDATFPGGEIRGQLTPEPGTALLLVVGLAPLLVLRRKLASRS